MPHRGSLTTPNSGPDTIPEPVDPKPERKAHPVVRSNDLARIGPLATARRRDKPASSTFDVANLLPELLVQVFGEVERSSHPYLQPQPIRKDYLLVGATWNRETRMDGSLISYRRNAIGSLTRVCKHWQPVAEGFLYRSVSLRTTKFYNDPTSLLLRTVKGTPRLAGLIRELRMLREPGHKGPQFTMTHASIIAACTQLSHLTLIGFDTTESAYNALRSSLTGLGSLRSLVLSQDPEDLGFAGSEVGLCSATELLQWMSHWRDIEHVVLLTNEPLPPSKDGGQSAQTLSRQAGKKGRNKKGQRTTAVLAAGVSTGQAASNSVANAPSNPSHASLQHDASFPQLRTFCFLKATISDNILRLLQTASPSLTSFGGNLHSTSTMALHDALTQWAPTLRNLVLLNSTHPVVDPHIEGAISNLTHLRFLHTSSDFIPPHALQYLPALEELEYGMQLAAHGYELAEVIPRLRHLSRLLRIPIDGLRALTIRELGAQGDRLRSVCAAHGVSFHGYSESRLKLLGSSA
ncbi:hypothetical protein BC835DRAFT_1304629 [Cytidiella melzeri]|nr:hypothetical protein BC835DRAFT_1304629 [Cytidiella melzeri]